MEVSFVRDFFSFFGVTQWLNLYFSRRSDDCGISFTSEGITDVRFVLVPSSIAEKIAWNFSNELLSVDCKFN